MICRGGLEMAKRAGAGEKANDDHPSIGEDAEAGGGDMEPEMMTVPRQG